MTKDNFLVDEHYFLIDNRTALGHAIMLTGRRHDRKRSLDKLIVAI